VAGELIRAVKESLGEEPKIMAAGRTDAGVHALGQVANFYTRSSQPVMELRELLNDALPKDVAILRIDDVAPSFHARHSAKERIYLYRISTRRSAFLKELAWWVKSRLDTESITAAGRLLVGRRDFSNFADKATIPEDPVLTLFDIRVDRDGTLIDIRFRAERFLPRMVRRITGVLVAVAQGRMPVASVPNLFTTPLPEVAAWTAPPSGLFLEAVLYDEREAAAPAYRGGKGGEKQDPGGILVWRPGELP